MDIEILFPEVCCLYGDGQNAEYLRATLPNANFHVTALDEEPYFATHKVDMIYVGAMSEGIQRRVIRKLMPLKNRLEELINAGTPILATGNAGEVFAKHITYVTEDCEIDGLGIFDLEVKTNLFDRYNGKVIGDADGITVVGFRSQFSFLFGDNSQNYFIKCERGDGINRQSKLEGMRKNNLICTQLIGPILPLNPLFTEYFIGLAGVQAEAAYKEAAMEAYNERVQVFRDPNVVFGNNK